MEVGRPGRYAFPDHGFAVEISVSRAGAVAWPLAIRTRRAGDRWRPDGGSGSKSLKRWLIDRKVPQERRDSLVVLARGSDIVAIPELGAVAEGLGPAGGGLVVRLASAP